MVLRTLLVALLLAGGAAAPAGVIARARVALAPDPVDAVAFSPDGRLLATSGSRGPVRLRDAESFEPVATLPQVGGVVRMAFTPHGRRLLVAGEVVVSYDVETGREVRRYRDHGRSLTDMLLSPDGRTMVTSSMDEPRLLVRDVASGAVLRDSSREAWDLRRGPAGSGFLFKTGAKQWVHEGFREGPVRPFAPPVPAMSLALSRDGGWLVCANGHLRFDLGPQPGRLTLHRLVAGGYRRVGALETDDPHVFNRLAFSPDGRLLVAAGRYALLRSWSVPDLVERRAVREPEAGGWPVSDLAFSPDGRLLAAAVGKPAPLLVRTEGLERIAPWPGHGRRVGEFAFSFDGTRVVTIGEDNLVGVWDAKTLRRVARHRIPDGFEPVSVRAPAAELLLCQRDTHVIETWPGGRPVMVFESTTGGVRTEDVIPVRSRAEAAFFEADGEGVLLRVKGPFRRIGALDAEIPFGEVPRAVRDDSVIVDGGAQLRPRQPGKAPVRPEVVRKDLASGEEQVRRPPGGEAPAGWEVGILPGGRHFHVSVPDVRVYDLEACRLVGVVTAPRVARDSITFSHDGARVAFVTSGTDAEARVHEVETGERVASWSVTAGATRIRLSPKGERAALLGDDGWLEVRAVR